LGGGVWGCFRFGGGFGGGGGGEGGLLFGGVLDLFLGGFFGGGLGFSWGGCLVGLVGGEESHPTEDRSFETGGYSRETATKKSGQENETLPFRCAEENSNTRCRTVS